MTVKINVSDHRAEYVRDGRCYRIRLSGTLTCTYSPGDLSDGATSPDKIEFVDCALTGRLFATDGIDLRETVNIYSPADARKFFDERDPLLREMARIESEKLQTKAFSLDDATEDGCP